MKMSWSHRIKVNPLALDPKSKAGRAFQNIARRLMGEQVPFMDLDTHGIWQRLLGRK